MERKNLHFPIETSLCVCGLRGPACFYIILPCADLDEAKNKSQASPVKPRVLLPLHLHHRLHSFACYTSAVAFTGFSAFRLRDDSRQATVTTDVVQLAVSLLLFKVSAGAQKGLTSRPEQPWMLLQPSPSPGVHAALSETLWQAAPSHQH